MAADTQVAPPPDAPESPPAAEQVSLPIPPKTPDAAPIESAPSRSGLSWQEVRRNALVEAFEKGTTPELQPDSKATIREAAPPPTTPVSTEVDKSAQNRDTEPQTQALPEVSAAGSPSTEPTTEAKEAAPSAPVSPPEARAKPALPDEYQTAEHEALYKDDPLLRRQVRSLWLDPNLSDIAKVQKIEARVADAKVKSQVRLTAAQEEQRLWDEGDFDTLRQRREAQTQSRALTAEAERILTQLLAIATGADPHDEGFLDAGKEAQSEDERFRLFGEWIVKHSPIGRTEWQERTLALQAQHEQTVAQIKAEHDQAIKTLEEKYKDSQATAVTQASAQARAGNPPPRSIATLPAGVEATKPEGPSITTARAAMNQYFQDQANKAN